MSGWPISVWAHPVPSFPHPIEGPNTEPDEGVLVQFCFNRDYMPYLIGACSQLLLQSTWLGGEDPENPLTDRMLKLTQMIRHSDFCNIGELTSVSYGFASSDGDFSVPDGYHGLWVADNGWRTQWYNDGFNWLGSLDARIELPASVYPVSLEVSGEWFNDTAGTADGMEVSMSVVNPGVGVSSRSREQVGAGVLDRPYYLLALAGTVRTPVNQIWISQSGLMSDADLSDFVYFTVNSLTLYYYQTVL